MPQKVLISQRKAWIVLLILALLVSSTVGCAPASTAPSASYGTPPLIEELAWGMDLQQVCQVLQLDYEKALEEGTIAVRPQDPHEYDVTVSLANALGDVPLETTLRVDNAAGLYTITYQLSDSQIADAVERLTDSYGEPLENGETEENPSLLRETRWILPETMGDYPELCDVLATEAIPAEWVGRQHLVLFILTEETGEAPTLVQRGANASELALAQKFLDQKDTGIPEYQAYRESLVVS